MPISAQLDKLLGLSGHDSWFFFPLNELGMADGLGKCFTREIIPHYMSRWVWHDRLAEGSRRVGPSLNRARRAGLASELVGRSNGSIQTSLRLASSWARLIRLPLTSRAELVRAGQEPSLTKPIPSIPGWPDPVAISA